MKVKQIMDELQWHYEELLKMLVLLASNHETQLAFYCEDELAIDYELALQPRAQQFVARGYFDEQTLAMLLEIDRFFEQRSGHDAGGFWREIETHGDWQQLRLMSKSVLKSMGLEKLRLKMDIEKQLDKHQRVIAIQADFELDQSEL